MNSNQSGADGGIIRGPFQGSLAHLVASGGLWSLWAISWPSPHPSPCQPDQICMVQKGLLTCTGVSKIYIFYVQLAPIWGILGPLKSVFALFWPFLANKANIPPFPHKREGRLPRYVCHCDKSSKIRYSYISKVGLEPKFQVKGPL